MIEKKIKEHGKHFHILVCFFFSMQYETGLDARFRFQPIKFVNLVVPSPCETEPYI